MPAPRLMHQTAGQAARLHHRVARRLRTTRRSAAILAAARQTDRWTSWSNRSFDQRLSFKTVFTFWLPPHAPTCIFHSRLTRWASVSLAPGFSRVLESCATAAASAACEPPWGKPLKRFSMCNASSTRLKPGANGRRKLSGLGGDEISGLTQFHANAASKAALQLRAP